MPVGTLKNHLYSAALPVLGKRCCWKHLQGEKNGSAVEEILKRHHVVGAVIQTIHEGKLSESYVAGNARLSPRCIPAQKNTFFRTASVAKLAAALLVFRLQTLGRLRTEEDISDFLGYRVRNPKYPQTAITLGMLLSHRSSILDSASYFAGFASGLDLAVLLAKEDTFASWEPGMGFCYSNLAAGMVGCLLEMRFGQSVEALAQEYLFRPLEAAATFDIRTLESREVADSYRVLPSRKAPSFSAGERHKNARAVEEPNPARHYLLASGNLFATGEGMAKLLLAAMGKAPGGGVFLSEESFLQMRNPLGEWPEKEVHMRHGMGLLVLQEDGISKRTLYGHQGFAYGAVNGCFFDACGEGFVCLNSGASEARVGHLSLLNRDLIRLFLP